MSRSRLRHPYHGILCAESEKDDKVAAHRQLRVAQRTALARLVDDPDGEVVAPILREVSQRWKFAKDGKTRFDPARWPRLMRK